MCVYIWGVGLGEERRSSSSSSIVVLMALSFVSSIMGGGAVLSMVERQNGVKCELGETSSSSSGRRGELEIGSPIIVVEAPKVLKTAASMPCLRANTGLLKPGDVGRIVSRKPKDVWAVRLSIGTYLLDAKYFKPLVLDQ